MLLVTRHGLEGVPAVAGDDGADDLPPSFQGDHATVSFEFAPGNGVKTIAFAEGRPVQAIGLVQDHFIFMGRAIRPLGRAIEDFNKILTGGAGRVGDDNDRMGLPTEVRLINFPGVHSLAPLRAAAFNTLKAARPTASACLSG